MATVAEWFNEFAASLVERSGRVDFPMADSGYWDDFRNGLVRIGATWPEADEAASVVCDMPGLFPADYRPKVVEAIKKIQARKQLELSGVPVGSLDEAKLASRDCIDCLGSGLTSRYIEGRDANFGFACRCPMGRWIRAQHGEKCPFRDDPYWLPTRRPFLGASPEILTPADLTRFVASLAASKDGAGRYVPARAPRDLDRDSRAVPARSDLAASIGDPVVGRELARRAPREPAAVASLPDLPEDHNDGWF